MYVRTRRIDMPDDKQMEKRNIVEQDRTPVLEKRAVDEGTDWTEISREFDPKENPATAESE